MRSSKPYICIPISDQIVRCFWPAILKVKYSYGKYITICNNRDVSRITVFKILIPHLDVLLFFFCLSEHFSSDIKDKNLPDIHEVHLSLTINVRGFDEVMKHNPIFSSSSFYFYTAEFQYIN